MSQFLYRYPLSGVTIRESAEVPLVTDPLFSGPGYQVSPSEYALHINGVGHFYAANGNTAEYAPDAKADPAWVRLCLNSQVLVALLHQRKMINFHASSFIFKNRGVMLLGETGAGKSSITSAFVLNGASFLTDDLTVVTFENNRPLFFPLSRSIKLDKKSLVQLEIPDRMTSRAEEGTGKYYLSIENQYSEKTSLDIIIKIEVGSMDAPQFYIPGQSERFSILRSEICSWEMLKGMPETEYAYLNQLVQTVRETKMIRVVRPPVTGIREMYESIMNRLVKEL